jgi:hypothetical protein
MSKNVNVNPDHYKTGGRERQGEEVDHEANRRQLRLAELVKARNRAKARTPARTAPPGATKK